MRNIINANKGNAIKAKSNPKNELIEIVNCITFTQNTNFEEFYNFFKRNNCRIEKVVDGIWVVIFTNDTSISIVTHNNEVNSPFIQIKLIHNDYTDDISYGTKFFLINKNFYYIK